MMEKRGWRLAAVAALGWFGAAIAGASPVSAQTGKPLWDKIEQSGELVCAAMAANPLSSWKVDGPEQYAGYEINFCRQIAQDLSKTMGKPIALKFHEVTWSTIVLELQSGKVDLYPAMSVTPERLKAIDMAGPVHALADCVVNRKGLPPRTTWAQYDDPKLRMATVSGTADEQIAREMAPHASNLSFKQLSEGALAVQSGRADILAASVLLCLDVLKKAPDAFGDIVFPTPVRSLPSSAGMRKDGDGRFRDWMQHWAETARADGTTKRLHIEAMKAAGIDTAKLPTEVTF